MCLCLLGRNSPTPGPMPDGEDCTTHLCWMLPMRFLEPYAAKSAEELQKLNQSRRCPSNETTRQNPDVAAKEIHLRPLSPMLDDRSANLFDSTLALDLGP
jgi:hypothetical protein